ncbi:hypothetical protein G5C60_13015 [Streptomyces sp. HC44]|uniref:Uncharacterized protein n=1 Tax=Streptomyces scabichelini TaxID=2711217 RepID=A0A6G4V3D4_9ACTN|nr:hypothetical protein [Streptomyces scabichelini]NGO08516.1 hypothetical protein [Streptomyces scabichelini]
MLRRHATLAHIAAGFGSPDCLIVAAAAGSRGARQEEPTGDVPRAFQGQQADSSVPVEAVRFVRRLHHHDMTTT